MSTTTLNDPPTATALATRPYPPDGHAPLVRGDPWFINVHISRDGTPIDTTGWTWQAQIRRDPDAPLLAQFVVTSGGTPPDATTPCRVVLQLDADQTRTIPDGAVFDLQQTTPETRTWWIARLRIAPDVSH